MSDWKIWDVFFLIPKLQRIIKAKLDRYSNYSSNKSKLMTQLAWIYTILIFIITLAVLGVIIHISSIFEIPVITELGQVMGLKYLFGADKFRVIIDDAFTIKTEDNFTIDFIVDSDIDTYSFITVYYRPYEDDIIPKYKYTTEHILTEGKSDNNKVSVYLFAPHNSGRYEICIIVDDKSMWGINKYEDCPSYLKIID